MFYKIVNLLPKILSYLALSTFFIFEIEDEEKNIQWLLITPEKKANCEEYSIIRTNFIDVMQPDLVDILVGKEKWIMIPIYTWIKQCFDKKSQQSYFQLNQKEIRFI